MYPLAIEAPTDLWKVCVSKNRERDTGRNRGWRDGLEEGRRRKKEKKKRKETYSPPTRNVMSVKIRVRTLIFNVMTTGIGMRRVTRSVRMSLPTMAYPAGIAEPQWSR